MLSRSDVNGFFHARLALRLRLHLFGMEVLRVMVLTFGDAGSAREDVVVCE